MINRSGLFGTKSDDNSVNTKQTDEKETAPSLSCDQRPDELREAIDSAFNSVKSRPCYWGLYNGREEEPYQVAGVNEYKLVKQLILNNPDRSDFYVLDIGAGEFGFSKGLSQFLNQDKDLASKENIKIHIISLRGETYKGPSDISEGICHLYNLGAFPVENMLKEFKQLNMDFIGKIDIAVSNSTFRHLVDPVGTFLQTHNLLRLKTGLFLLDGFNYECDNLKSVGNEASFENIFQLFFLTGEAFLLYCYTFAATANHFIIQKGTQELSLPLKYKNLELRDKGNLSKNYVCIFHSDLDSPNKEFNYEAIRALPMGTYMGDPELFSFLDGYKLLADFGLTKKVKYVGSFEGVSKKSTEMKTLADVQTQSQTVGTNSQTATTTSQPVVSRPIKK